MLKMKMIQGESHDFIVLSGIYGSCGAGELSKGGPGAEAYAVSHQPCSISHGRRTRFHAVCAQQAWSVSDQLRKRAVSIY